MGLLPADPAAAGMSLNRQERLARRIVLKRQQDAVQQADADQTLVEKLLPRLHAQKIASDAECAPVVDASASSERAIQEPVTGTLMTDLLKLASVRPEEQQ